MADVIDRGQIIVVSGLVLAVAFVVLALLLNTVIFTENLASRGTDLGGRDAVEFQRNAIGGIGGLVDAENDEEHTTSASVRTNVSDGVGEWSRLMRIRRAQAAIVADVTLVEQHNGALIRQTDPSRALNDSANDPDWVLARDINDTRQFAMTFTGGLNSTSDPADGFKVTLVGDGGNTWQLFVYDDSGVELAVKNGSGAISADVCSPAGLPLTVDLTAGTVNGTPCPAIEFAKGLSEPYDITFEDGDDAQGTYNLTVNVSAGGAVEPSGLNDPDTASSPYFVRAVYSVVVDVYYETADLVYGSEVRIARGEPA